MKHRIFVAINLPEDLKTKLSLYQEKWPDLPIRWTKPENIHITLAFLGYVADEDIPDICQSVKEVAENIEPFSLSLNEIIYGPPDKMPPRMIWAEGGESKSLSALKGYLEAALSGAADYEPDKRLFKPHITLGRIKTWQWKQIEPEERPEVNENVNLRFDVNSIEVMESFLKRGGPQYEILNSYALGPKE